MRRVLRVVVALAAVMTAACSDDAELPPAVTSPDAVEQLTVEVGETRPHDPAAFTQGLVVSPEGTLYESTGLRGRSTLREVDPETGEVLRSVPLDPAYFGEGLALVDDRLVQLTWQSGVALVYDRQTFDLVDEHRYDGEGWGLCHDGERLVMSDGTATLTFRDPDTFEVLDRVEVQVDGEPVDRLNELECVDGSVWANVWQTDRIVEIDPASGDVVASVDAAGLLDPEAEATADVLNGIAHDGTGNRFLLTGKLWPELFVVELVPTAG